MTVGELIELLQNCYEDAEVYVDTRGVEASDAQITSIEFDDSENVAYIKVEE